jgi:hypothetical protein
VSVDLREGREGLNFPGCHFRARRWGRLWEQRRVVRFHHLDFDCGEDIVTAISEVAITLEALEYFLD